jgi:hypothetical protein
MKTIIIISLMIKGHYLYAQLPGTEVWLFDISAGKGTVSLENGKNISSHKGYDNQPSFSEDGKGLFYTSEAKDGQTEIMYYQLDSTQIKQLTHTPESEYSPRGSNQNTFKCVRVDKDSSQRIYNYKLSKRSPTLLYPKSDSIGYFDEADWTLVYFKITKPPTIWLADDGKEFLLSPNPGRCIRTEPNKSKVWFTLNTSGSHLLLTAEGKNVSLITTLPDSAEFFDFWDEYTLIISTKNGLKLFGIKTTSETETQTDIPLPEGIILTNISRIALSPDKRKLAIVAKE